ALRAEAMTEARKLGDQLAVVVDLAIEYDADAAILVVQRLLARLQVDDRQAAMAEADAGVDVNADFVGTAMVLRLVHPHEHVPVDVATTLRIENAGDSAHAQ